MDDSAECSPASTATSTVILPFDEVVAALGRTGERELGLQVVELDTIAGTVDRRTGFDRSFRPTSSRVRTRWERVAAAMRRGEPLPPVSLYRVGEVHFVRDGHHRVSAARALGWPDIDAYVTEVLTRVGAGRELRISDLPLKSHERLFRERVPLSPDRAGRIRLTDAHELRLAGGGRGGMGLSPRCRSAASCAAARDVAEAWFDHEFAPVIELLREADMLGPGTEADAYHRIASERYELTRSHDWSDEIVARVKAAEHKR